jgi:hypothetical protein
VQLKLFPLHNCEQLLEFIAVVHWGDEGASTPLTTQIVSTPIVGYTIHFMSQLSYREAGMDELSRIIPNQQPFDGFHTNRSACF